MEKTMGPMISLGHRGNRSGGGQSLFIHKHLAYSMPDIILGTLQISIHLTCILILKGKYFYSILRMRKQAS